jgi:flagellar hook-associated protein 2
MALGLDGLASGLPTADLIASLMAIEAVPQNLLKNSAIAANTSVAALQALNGQIAALATLAGTTAKPGSLDFYSATSSSTKVTATAAAGAENSTLDIVVGKLAQSQVGVTASMSEWSTPAVLTLVTADGTTKEITADSTSLDDVVKAFNASGTSVTATKVASGTDANGVARFRLQFSGKDSGASSAFTVYSGSAADVTAGSATDVLTQAGAAVIRTAQDASVTLWAGTPAAQVLTSKTNTFADLLPGVSVTVSGASVDPVTISVARDTTASSAAAASVINALNGVLAYITTRTVSTASTDASGKPILSGGVFTGDNMTRVVSQKLLDAASAPVAGHSPSEYGISITKTGAMEFSAQKFAAAYEKDPVTVQAAVSEIAARIAAAAAGASDKTTGTVSQKITGTQSTITNLNDQVARWDDRLATRKTNLQRMYSAFEVRMSNMNAQMTWLTSQVDSLQAQKG